MEFNFQYLSTRTRIVMAPGAVAQVGPELDRLGCRRALVVCGRSARSTPLLEQVMRVLGPRCAGLFDQVRPHSGVDVVEAGAALARELAVDVLVSVGGGSASDTAKAIAILLAEGGRLPDHATRFTPPDQLVRPALDQPKLPLVAVPTTASGAEMTPGLGIRDQHGVKLLFWDPGVAARVVILDPAAVAAVPTWVLTSTGMNGLAHCVEGLYSRECNPISDALALHGLRYLAAALPRVARGEGEEAAATLMVGACLAGLVIANARVAIHHAVCHGLGARCGLHHGVANAIMLPHAMRYNLDSVPERLALAAAALGETAAAAGLSAREGALAAIRRVEALQREIGVPLRLRDAGADRACLAAAAEDTLADRGTYFNPRPPAGPGPILAMLEAAW